MLGVYSVSNRSLGIRRGQRAPAICVTKRHGCNQFDRRFFRLAAPFNDGSVRLSVAVFMHADSFPPPEGLQLMMKKRNAGMTDASRHRAGALSQPAPLLVMLSAALIAAESQAALVLPTAITVSEPAGSNNPMTGAYTDDVFLASLTFPGVVFSSGASFSAVRDFVVLAGRENINAEWGDADTGTDGDDNPFLKAGLNPADQESTVPSIQEPALINAFNSLSLSEMSDGEGGLLAFKVLFQAGLMDNDPLSLDTVPELVFFERGMNDSFDIEVIVGGTFDDPLYSGRFSVSSNAFWPSGISVNTTEIDDAQQIGVAGIDLNDFGLGAGAIAYGFRLTVTAGGPDLNGFFLSTDDPANFLPPLDATPMPLPSSLLLMLAALGGIATSARRSTADPIG